MASPSYELGDIKNDNAIRTNNPKNINLDPQPEVVIVDGRTTSRYLQGHDPPRDKYNLVFFILLIHGMGTLMPWNMFINAESYFRGYKLATPNATIGSQEGQQQNGISPAELDNLRQQFLPLLGAFSQLPNVLFNLLNLLVNMGSGNLKLRVNLTLALEAVIFLITIVLAFVDSSLWPRAFFWITMCTVAVLNMASGIYQNCIFGTGAKFPGSYTNAILIGSNLSGTFTSTVNLLSIWLAPEPQVAAIYYFITALFVILVCLISYNLLPRNNFFRRFDQADQDKPISLEIAQDGPAPIPTKASQPQKNDEIPDTLRSTVDAMVPRPEYEQHPTFMSELLKKRDVLMKCWPQCLNVFLTFYITLALFPAVMSDITQVGDNFSDKYFVSFACFFIFNVFAMIGNLISGCTTWPGKDRLWILVAVRILFVPFFLFCNFKAKTRTWPVYITSDITYIIGNIIFATTSGYLSSLCMMFASSDLKPDEAPKAGMLAAFFLVLGIFLGINSSFLLIGIVV